MLKPLDHSKCCASKLDRIRHELDRGLKMKKREEERKEREHKEPRPGRLDEAQRQIDYYYSQLSTAENEALQALAERTK